MSSLYGYGHAKVKMRIYSPRTIFVLNATLGGLKG